ncbi:hypothetical protein [Actinomadura oligospora]|uniref:hypothetical protein n=1 Tax=Actinomadura oligospora TaxID=111804 RepID=UPI00047CAFD7|nr:hypothetical protein [Actinomadura oligospora]
MPRTRCRAAVAWTALGAAAALVGARPAFAEISPPTVIEGPWSGAPTYECDRIYQKGDILTTIPAKGLRNCKAFNGAPEKGPINGAFFIHWRPDEVQPDNNDNIYDVRCVPGKRGEHSGTAHVPKGVTATACDMSDVTRPWEKRPAYECDTATAGESGSPLKVVGAGNCRSLNGAPTDGGTGRFIVVSRDRSHDPNNDLECNDGKVDLPGTVNGTGCVYFH